MLLDTASLYFRAFFGVPDTKRGANQIPVNAVTGLLDMTARLIRTYQPQAVIACWDDDWRPDFRVALLPSYKAHRVAVADEEEVPDDLSVQIPIIVEVLAALGIPRVGVSGYEADDVIASYADRATGDVDIVTGDRDLFQMVREEPPIRVLYTARGISNMQLVDTGYVVDKHGVLPEQYADMAILRGDSSDGLPGVPGIGDKTAASLLRLGGTLANIRRMAERGDEQIASRLRAKLLESADYLDAAPGVVHVVRDLDLPPAPSALPTAPADPELLQALQSEFPISSSVGRFQASLAYNSEA